MHLGEAVRKIRQRQGQTLKQFAERFHVKYSAVSLWESGKTVPAWQNLAILLKLAGDEDEQDPILDALQNRLGLSHRPAADDVLASVAQAREWTEEIKHGPKSRQGRNTRSIRLLESAQRIVEEKGGPPLAVVAILENLESLLGRPGADAALREIASFVRYRINEFRDQAPAAEQARRMEEVTARWFGDEGLDDDEEDPK